MVNTIEKGNVVVKQKESKKQTKTKIEKKVIYKPWKTINILLTC